MLQFSIHEHPKNFPGNFFDIISMENSIVSARVELGDYANKVLNIIKIKYGLNDKSAAINKFIELYGDDILELEASEGYTKKVIELSNKHLKKYGVRKMSVEELNNLCGV